MVRLSATTSGTKATVARPLRWEVVFGRTDPAGDTPSRRDRRLTRYVRREVGAFSTFWQAPSDGGVDRIPPRSFADLAGHAPDLVLRPDVSSVYRAGPRRLAVRTAWSRLWGRQRVLNEKVLVPFFKPVLWLLHDGVPIGYAESDVDRLARIGAVWLESAGVRSDDVVVNVLPSGPNLPWWQTVVGCRRARLSAIHLGANPDADTVVSLRPTVLVGRPMDLLRLLATAYDIQPRLVLAVGRPMDQGLRARLAAAATGAPILSAWAPPGVRAMWSECRAGVDAGLHTWPASEVLELVDPLTGMAAPAGAGGEVVWTPLGWHGTVMLRMRTGVFGTLEDGVCSECGRNAPRLHVAGSTPHFFDVLDRHPDITAWQAELRTVDNTEELIVFLSTSRADRLEPMLRELDDALSATQFVVLPERELDRRIADADDARVVDLRPS